MAEVVMAGGLPVSEDWAKKFVPVPPEPRLTVEQQTRLEVLRVLVSGGKVPERCGECVDTLSALVLHGYTPPPPPPPPPPPTPRLCRESIELLQQIARKHYETLGENDGLVIKAMSTAIEELDAYRSCWWL